MIEGMSQAYGFILNGPPTRVKSTNVVSHVTCKKTVLTTLDVVFKTAAIICECWPFTRHELRGDRWVTDAAHDKKEGYRKEELGEFQNGHKSRA